MQNTFGENINLIFSIKAPELRFQEDGVNYGFIIDDNENRINTFPVLEYEERFLSADDSECYTCLSLFSYGQNIGFIRLKSSSLFNEKEFISKYGNKPFASFDDKSWGIFFEIIKVMLPEIDQRVVYKYSGWNKEMSKYLFGNLLIDINNVLPIESTLVKTDTQLSLKNNMVVCENINNIVQNISNNKIIGYICLMYLLLSHSKQRFVQTYRLCPEFVLSIVGETGSYKTTTSLALFNTYDSSVSSFEDSIASIRRMIQTNKAGVTLVDDYKISNTENDKKYEKLVRLSGDVQTTGKYVVGNKVIDELITGLTVITGEKRPSLQTSSYSRILFLDLELFPINLEVLTELQKSKADINSFIVLFIQFIMQDIDFDASCRTLFEKHRDELLQDTSIKGMHGRYYSMCAWLAMMWDVYAEFLCQHGVNMEYDFKSEIKSYIYSQHSMYDNNPIKLFKIGYMELVSSNEIIVADKNGFDNLNFDVIQYDEKLFLRSNGAYKKICKYWQDKGIDFSCSERKLRKLLYEAGILKDNGGKFTVEKKTKDNRSYSGYYLFKNIFINYGGTIDEKF